MTHSKNKLEHIIKDNGTEIWKDSNENLHQHDDLPAIIYPDGTEEYYKNGKRFREFGPKRKLPDGHEFWRTKTKNGLHRKDGAAIIFINGSRGYYIDGVILKYDTFKKQIRTHHKR